VFSISGSGSRTDDDGGGGAGGGGRFGREEAGARREVEAQPEPAPQPLGLAGAAGGLMRGISRRGRGGLGWLESLDVLGSGVIHENDFPRG